MFFHQKETKEAGRLLFFRKHKTLISIRISHVGPIVEWIQRGPPKTEVQVRFLLGLPSSLNCSFEPLYFKSLSLCLIGIINPRFELNSV